MLLDVTVNTVKVTSEGDKVEEVGKSFGKKERKDKRRKILNLRQEYFRITIYHFGQHTSGILGREITEDVKSCE